LTVRLIADEVTELLGVEAFAVSATATVGVVKVPADPPTVATWQLPVLVLVGQLKPAGELLGVKV
jgi:hypothetical protein